jgi:L-iditol 2-dehydrogenase
VYYNNRDLRLEERPRPEPGPGELLMQVEASGICGSDTMEWYRVAKAPLVLGHEVAGVVAAVGEGVTGFAPGDRIVTTHHVPCNECRYCRTDRHSVCDTLRSTSFDPGGFSEFVRLPPANVQTGTFLLPDTVSFEEASFVEPLACTVRGQRIAGVEEGNTVAVFGSGISGILHIQLARTLGAARIVATDVHPFRLEMARKLGADVVLDAGGSTPDEIREANSGRPADRVIVCTAARRALETAFQSVDRGGVILFFAPLAPDETVNLPLWDTWRNGISVVTSYSGPPHDMQTALDLIASRSVDVSSMITHRLALDEIGEGFRLMDEPGDSLKVIVEPQR